MHERRGIQPPLGRRAADWRRVQRLAENRARALWRALRERAEELSRRRDSQARVYARTTELKSDFLAERAARPPDTVSALQRSALRRRWLEFDLQSERFHLDAVNEERRIAEREARAAWRRLLALERRGERLESRDRQAARLAHRRREQRECSGPVQHRGDAR